MPRGPAILSSRSTNTSPRQSTSGVNDVVNAFSQKLTNTVNVKPVSSSRRSSFSMDNLLHPNKKEKKRDDSKERETRKDKRLSMPGSKGSKTKDKHTSPSPRVGPTKGAKFDMVIESPPLIFYGNANNSTGALFSGTLKLAVDDPSGSIKLNEFEMTLQAVITTHKPVSKDCKKCTERNDEIKKWTFITEPTSYASNRDHQFPFSYLFPGHLPPTTEAHLGSLTYSLLVQAVTSTGEKIQFIRPLKISRAIPPGPEKSSIRIFPPTNLTGRLQLPPVVHPIGTFPVSMSLCGVVEKRAESQTRWRLRKMMWRIEEHCKVVSKPCAKHAVKVTEGKAIQHTDTRTISTGDMKNGWKTDFDTIGGEIVLEFECSLATNARYKPVCDVDSAAGLEIKHVLIIELIVAEEFCPNRNTTLITPTGAARVLRMQFNLNVTERAGMGISWDEEMPPMYEDVPPSPPGYGNTNKSEEDLGSAVASIEDYFGPTIVPHDLERLASTNPDGLPHYREMDPNRINHGLSMRTRRDTSGSEEAESSTRRRLAGIRIEDLEHETAYEAYRRRRLEENDQGTTEEEDVGEGLAGNAPVQQ